MSEPNYRFQPTSAPPLRSSVAAAESGTLAFMTWDVATTYESRRKVLFNEFKDLAAYFHSRRL